MKATKGQIAYSSLLMAQHRRQLHDLGKNPMCRLCHPEEAALLDQLKDEENDRGNSH